MNLRRDLVISCVVILTACTAAAGRAPDPTNGTVAGVGLLPPELGTAIAVDRTTVPESTSAPTIGTVPPGGTVGDAAAGNSVLVIGDSILASTSSRYDTNDLCKILVPNGWRVEVEAETGRFIEFGKKVLDARLSAGFDAFVIGLGSNYNNDRANYRDRLTAMVERLAPRPVVLVTVTEFLPNRSEVNEIIHDLAATHPNVTIVDWNAVTSTSKGLLGGDGLHLTNRGREQLSFQIGLTMGTAPESPGKCLPSWYTDDSAGSVDGTSTTTTTTKPRHGGSGGTSTTSTTVRPRSTTTTTVKPGSTTTTKPATTSPPPTTPPPVVTDGPPDPPST